MATGATRHVESYAVNPIVLSTWNKMLAVRLQLKQVRGQETFAQLGRSCVRGRETVAQSRQKTFAQPGHDANSSSLIWPLQSVSGRIDASRSSK